MSFRPLFYFVFFFAAALWAWDRAITQDGLAVYLDNNPTAWKADVVYFALGSYHELFNRDTRALENYEKVVTKYPQSPYAADSLYGAASSLERMRQWEAAIEKYQLYLEKYPDGRFSKSVINNIQILKSSR